MSKPTRHDEDQDRTAKTFGRRTCERGKAADKEHHGAEGAKDQSYGITAAENNKSNKPKVPHQKPSDENVPPSKTIESLCSRQTERREGGIAFEELRFGDRASGRLEVEPPF